MAAHRDRQHQPALDAFVFQDGALAHLTLTLTLTLTLS
jgi:hypothetical protein